MEIFLQLTCNVLNRDIVIIPAFKDQAHVSAMGFTITKSSTPNNKEPLFLFAFSESKFSSPHYQSIRPGEENVILEYIKHNRQSLDASRSTTLNSAPVELTFDPPSSSSLIGSSVSKFVVENGRLVRRSEDLSTSIALLNDDGSPPECITLVEESSPRSMEMFEATPDTNYRVPPIRLFRCVNISLKFSVFIIFSQEAAELDSFYRGSDSTNPCAWK